MSLGIQSVQTERQWRSATSLNEAEFQSLGAWFEAAYKSAHEVSHEEAQSNLPMEFVFKNCGDLLFFVLFSLKNPTTFDVNGLIFGISQRAAEYNFKQGLKVLRLALEQSGQLPRQAFKDLADFQAYVQEHECLKIDATEIAVQRPRDKALQKARYSGKKRGTPENP